MDALTLGEESRPFLRLLLSRPSTEPNDSIDTDRYNIEGEMITFYIIGQVTIGLIHTTEVIEIAALTKGITMKVQ